MSSGYLSTSSSQRIDGFLGNNSQTQRIDLGVRSDGMSTAGFLPAARVRTDGMPSDYLPTSHRNDMSIVRTDDYLQNSQAIVPDVQFEASSLIADYDFIVSDVATPEVGIEPETEDKFFTPRQFVSEHQTHPVLEHSSILNNENHSCQALQKQQTQHDEHDAHQRQHQQQGPQLLQQRVQHQDHNQSSQLTHQPQEIQQRQMQKLKHEHFQDIDSPAADEEVTLLTSAYEKG